MSAADGGRELLAAAQRLLRQGYSPLLRQVYDLGAQDGRKVRPGFEALAPQVLRGYRELFDAYQVWERQEPGALGAAVVSQLELTSRRYDQLRSAVATKVPEVTPPPPGDVLFVPPAPGESAADWVARVAKDTVAPIGSGLAIGVGLGLVALLFLMTRRR